MIWKSCMNGILPNIGSIIIVDLILGFAGNIGIETGLSFWDLVYLQHLLLGTLIAYARTQGYVK